jgi:DNA-binding YbaB/EbfC family protein
MAKSGFRGGFPGGGSQMNMMKQAQKMQQDFMKMQQDLESREFEFTAGGGAVKATMIGTRQLESIEINPEVVDPEDVEMLQDLVISAVNEALRQADEAMNTSMNALTNSLGLGGLGIPGL